MSKSKYQENLIKTVMGKYMGRSGSGMGYY